MNMTDNLQLHKIYDFMIGNEKYLKPQRICNMCKQDDVEFNGTTNICSECYSKYVKLSKQEKKEYSNEKTS